MQSSFIIFILTFLSANSSLAVCTSPSGITGQIQWIGADNKVKYCDGTSWRDSSQTTEGSCAGTASGTIKNNAGALQYCNGTNWIKMSGGSTLGSCSGSPVGTIQFDSGTSKLRFCNGTSWIDLAAASGTAQLQFEVGLMSPTPPDPACVYAGGIYYDNVVTVKNIGSSSTSGITVSFPSNPAGSYSIISNECSISLSPGASCSITIGFTPPVPWFIDPSMATIQATETAGSSTTQNLEAYQSMCAMGG